jgi:hypothetical protein
MNYVTVKGYNKDDAVEIEVRNTDTNGVGGYLVPVCDLWGWLQKCRPCVVQRSDRQYVLPVQAAAGRPERAASVYA